MFLSSSSSSLVLLLLFLMDVYIEFLFWFSFFLFCCAPLSSFRSEAQHTNSATNVLTV